MIKPYPQPMLLMPIIILLSACNENSDDIAPVIKAPQISNISQSSTLVVGQTASFIATGKNLSSSNIKILSTNCNNLQLQAVKSTQVNFSCQPQQYGKQQIIINSEQNKRLLSKTFVVDTAETHLLNDTGITGCVSDNNFLLTQCEVNEEGKWFVSVQDGAVGRDLLASKGQLTKQGKGNAGFDFSKVSATGELLADNSSTWRCVLDHTTGLLWEAKTTDGGLHDVSNSYTWYNPDEGVNGGFAGNISDGKNTDAFVKAVNQVGLCGHHDWSLPNPTQLQSIVDYSKESPAINTQYFLHTQQDIYWSSSSMIDGLQAVSIDFNFGVVRPIHKNPRFGNMKHFIRLVRSKSVSK